MKILNAVFTRPILVSIYAMTNESFPEYGDVAKRALAETRTS